MEKKSLNIKGVGSSDRVFTAVAKVTGISHSKLLSDSRMWPVVEARMLSAITFSRCGLVDKKIAWLINRKRSTVCKSRNVGIGLLEVSKTFKDKYQKVQSIITNQ